MASRPPEQASCTVIMLLFFASLLGLVACSCRDTGKETSLLAEKMDGCPEQTLLSMEQGFSRPALSLSSQTIIYKRSRRSSPLKAKGPRILHEVHSGPNPISNSFPMQADDTARKFKLRSQRKSP